MRALVVLFLLFGLVVSAHADSVYSWQDENGQTHYGNNPPKGAKSSTVHAGFSRYNSKKMLERIKVQSKKPADAGQILEQPLAITEKKNISEDTVLRDIEQQPAVVELDSKGSITSCSTTIRNKSQYPINAISVVFAFPDGSKVISTGPNVLRDGEEQKYFIADRQLPYRLNEDYLKKQLADNPAPEKRIELIRPKVIIGID